MSSISLAETSAHFWLAVIAFTSISMTQSQKCACDSSNDFIRVSDSLCFKNMDDGHLFIPPTAMFGDDVNHTEFLNALDLNGEPFFRLNVDTHLLETMEPLYFGGVLIISDGVSILIDTGVGEVAPFVSIEKKEGVTSLYQNLHDIGCGDIDVVVSSHLHWDHTGWNIRYDREQTAESEPGYVPSFDRSTVYYVQSDEYYYWKSYKLSQDDHPAIKQTMKQMMTHVGTLMDAGQIALRFGDYHLTKNVEVKRCIGHTPGHQCVYLYDDAKQPKVMLIGDATHIPYQVTKPSAYSVWDDDDELAAKTRLDLIEYAYQHSMLFAPLHYPGMGVIEKCQAGDRCRSQSGYVWRRFTDNEVKQWSNGDAVISKNPPKSEI